MAEVRWDPSSFFEAVEEQQVGRSAAARYSRGEFFVAAVGDAETKIPVELDQADDDQLVDSIETYERVRELNANGYPIAWLTQELGIYFKLNRLAASRRCKAALAKTIRAAYERLINLDPSEIVERA